MRDAIVVGAGIIGSTIAAALRNVGMQVVLIDDGREMAGTKPSGGHLKPTWFGGMKKSEWVPALRLLEDIWGMKSELFTIKPTGAQTEVFRVDTDIVVANPRMIGCVRSVNHLDNFPVVKGVAGPPVNQFEERCRLLIIATGAWAGELLPEVAVTNKQGVSFRVEGQLEQPFIRSWSPYKQIVAHQQSDNEIWVGDGSAILKANWNEQRTTQCRMRCLNSLGGGHRVTSTIHGLRAYAKSKGNDPCLLQKLGPRAWVATGAGKSGTIAAGWAANRILQNL
jgi:glycine/D-amino acid oxidase-like deaminating enzyme